VDAFDPLACTPDHVFDGGDLDCGSGLVLLIRDHMRRVPEGGVLEMRSREPSVADDLPPWCRMVGHTLLGAAAGDGFRRYFIRRGAAASQADEAALERDKDRARQYEWRARGRLTGPMRTTVYCRNFSLEVGQPASFEERDERPSAIEHLLAALAGDLAAGFAAECARAGLQVDDVEITVRARLGNVLAHLGLEDGDPALSAVDVRGFASSGSDERAVRDTWQRALARSPIAATLRKAADLTAALVVL
jgi:TusA-related sulfurtransferase